MLTDHQVSNTFFTIAKPFWDGLTRRGEGGDRAGRGGGQGLNDAAVLAAEAEAVAFLESKGLTVTTPDVAAFRAQVQEKFLASDFAKTWPAGLLDRINGAGA